MTTKEAIEYFESQVKLAAALGLHQPTISGWKKYPPAIRQLQLEKITKGKLKAEPDLLKVTKRAA
jgi:DNA-binding transcriptional regulator YdaS (Cro superfamily)